MQWKCASGVEERRIMIKSKHYMAFRDRRSM